MSGSVSVKAKGDRALVDMPLIDFMQLAAERRLTITSAHRRRNRLQLILDILSNSLKLPTEPQLREVALLTSMLTLEPGAALDSWKVCESSGTLIAAQGPTPRAN
jgi:hypothetical protein